MASESTPPTHFHLFPDLPPELRNQVWRATLPDRIPPALYLYRLGCWWPRHLTEADVGYEPDSGDNNLVLEFCHSKLGAARLDVPTAAVSSEARHVALTWAAEQGVEVRASGQPETAGPIFVCPFRPSRDLLYVPLDHWDNLFMEPLNRPWELDHFLDRNYSTRSEVYRIAAPEALLQRHRSASFTLDELFDSFPMLQALYVVMDPQPDFGSLPGSDVPWRWEIAEKQGGWELVWNSIARGWHVRNSGAAQEAHGGELFRRVLEAAQEVQKGLNVCHKHGFEVRVVCLEAGREGRENG